MFASSFRHKMHVGLVVNRDSPETIRYKAKRVTIAEFERSFSISVCRSGVRTSAASSGWAVHIGKSVLAQHWIEQGASFAQSVVLSISHLLSKKWKATHVPIQRKKRPRWWNAGHRRRQHGAAGGLQCQPNQARTAEHGIGMSLRRYSHNAPPPA